MIQRNGIVIRNGRQRFNRALFGYYQSRDFHWGNHRFKVLAGELPLFLLEDGYDRGKLRFHTTNSPLENLSGMEMRHYRNEVSYTWDDLPLLLAVTPLKDASGAMVWLHASAPICLPAMPPARLSGSAVPAPITMIRHCILWTKPPDKRTSSR